jgi:hypothetical protein
LDPLAFDPIRTRDNAREADTEDLLDRITVFRSGMQAAALAIIEAELRARGISRQEIEEHAQRWKGRVIEDADGLAVQCLLCRRPAVAEVRGWYRWLGVIPLFPRRQYYCDQHAPARVTSPSNERRPPE